MTESDIAIWMGATANGIAAVALLRDHLAARSENKRQRDAIVDGALIALRAAATNTERYIEARRAGENEDGEKEMEIENLWHSVAVAMRRIDEPLAHKFFIKAGYWRHPDQWSEQDVRRAGIGLQQIVLEANFLLHRQG